MILGHMTIRTLDRFLVTALVGFLLSLGLQAIWIPINFVAIFNSLNIAAVFGACATLDQEIPFYKRVATGYLIYVSVCYLWAAISGMFQFWDIFDEWISTYLVVPPFALFHGLYHCTTHFYCTGSDFVIPLDSAIGWVNGLNLLSSIELAVSALSVVAAYFLASKEWARRVWIGVLALAVAAAVANLIVDQLNVRAFPPQDHEFDLLLRSTLWALSYVVAYWATVERTQPRTRAVSGP